MLNPNIVDAYIAEYTAHELRGMLLFRELTDIERAHIIAAIYYSEVNDND